MPLPYAAAMPRRKSSTSSGSGSGEDGSSDRRQRDHLDAILAEQIVVDQLARDLNPGRTVLICFMQIQSSSGCAPWLLTM